MSCTKSRTAAAPSFLLSPALQLSFSSVLDPVHTVSCIFFSSLAPPADTFFTQSLPSQYSIFINLAGNINSPSSPVLLKKWGIIQYTVRPYMCWLCKKLKSIASLGVCEAGGGMSRLSVSDAGGARATVMAGETSHGGFPAVGKES